MSEWRETTLGELCSHVITGGTPDTKVKEYYRGGTIPWVKTKEVNYKPIVSTESYITQEGLENSSAKMIPTNSIIIAMYGQGDTAGRVAVNKIPVCTNQACCNLVIDKAKADYCFIYYVLSNSYDTLVALKSGSAQPNLNTSLIKGLEISVPDVNTQHAIAEVLSSLDDKIDLLTRQNATLEVLAQTYFRQWFVENASEEWDKGKAEDYFDIAIGKTPPRNESQWFTDNPSDHVWISIADMGKSGLYISDSSEYLTVEAIDKFNIRVIPKGTVLLSFKLTVGRVAIAQCEMTTNEAIAHFKCKNGYEVEYLYCYLKSFDYYSLGSTSSIATAVNSKIIKAMPFIMPNNEIMKKFHVLTNPLFQKIETNTKQIQTLQKLRDTLLPKLISGEVRVKQGGNVNG